MREIVSEECYKVIRTLKYLFAKLIYDDFLIYYFIITILIIPYFHRPLFLKKIIKKYIKILLWYHVSYHIIFLNLISFS